MNKISNITPPEADTMRENALSHVEHGFNLIRLHKMDTDLACTCYRGEDCGQPGKHPMDRDRPKEGQARPNYQVHDALLQVQLDGGHFDQSFGVLLDGTDTLAVDVDARNGGLIGFEKLVADFPEVAGAGYIVETGSGGGSRHLYFSVPEGLRLKSALKEYHGIDFKSSGWVVAPGSLHKSGGRYSVALGSLDDIDAAPDGLIEALKKPERKGRTSGAPGDIDIDELTDMLSFIPCGKSSYNHWWLVGKALFGALGDDGFEIFDEWSSGGENYDGKAVSDKWEAECSKAETGGIGYIVNLARENGWTPAFDREEAAKVASDMAAVADVKDTPGEALLTRAGLPVDSSIFGWHADRGLTAWATDDSGKRTGFVSVGDSETESEWTVGDFNSFVRLPAQREDAPQEVLAAHDIRLAITLWHLTGAVVWALGGEMTLPVAQETAARDGLVVRLMQPEDLA